MAGTLRNAETPDSPDYSDFDRAGRMAEARYFFAIHDNFSKRQVADKFQLIGPDESTQYQSWGGFYAATVRMDWDGWRDGYKSLVAKDLERRGRVHLTAQLARNRKFGEKMGEMLNTIDTDASEEWNPRKRRGNIDSISQLQRAHSQNTTELLQIYELPTNIQKHTGVPDLNDPIELARRAERLAAAARAELEGNAGTDPSRIPTVLGGEIGTGGTGSATNQESQ